MKSLRALRSSILALLLVAGMAPLRAQEAGSVPEQSQSGEAQPGSAGNAAHEGHGAAGQGKAEEEEKDDTEKFKHSASVKGIARLTGLSLDQSYWAAVGLNFAVIAGIILWAARKFLPGAFRDRTAAIQKAMQEAQKASEEARAKLAEIEARLAKIDLEIGAMKATAEKEGASEEARLQAAAQEDVRKIVASAEQEIAAAGKAARRQLTAHAADLAVGLAQKQIHVDAATDQALVRNFAGQLGSGNSGKDRN